MKTNELIVLFKKNKTLSDVLEGAHRKSKNEGTFVEHLFTTIYLVALEDLQTKVKTKTDSITLYHEYIELLDDIFSTMDLKEVAANDHSN